MKKIKITIWLAGLFSLVISLRVVNSAQLTGREILEKAIHRYRGDDSVITVLLKRAKISNPNDVKQFTITTYRKVRPEVIKALVAVKKADDPQAKPVLFLIWDWQEKGKEDQLWYCLPSVGKYDRINSAKGEELTAKFGFSIEDMRTRNLDEAAHKFEGEVTEDGEKCYKVVSIPNNPQKEGFKQITSWIRPESFTPVKIEYLGLSGKIEKRLKVTKVEKIQGIWTELNGIFEDHRKDMLVHFELQKVEYNPKLPDNLFNFSQPPLEILK